MSATTWSGVRTCSSGFLVPAPRSAKRRQSGGFPPAVASDLAGGAEQGDALWLEVMAVRAPCGSVGRPRCRGAPALLSLLARSCGLCDAREVWDGAKPNPRPVVQVLEDALHRRKTADEVAEVIRFCAGCLAD